MIATQTPVYVTENTPGRFLRRTLFGNGIFSTLSGLLFILAANPVANFLGIQNTSILGLFNGDGLIFLIGIDLLTFAAGLFFSATRPTLNRHHAILAIELDVAWVAASVIVLLTGALPLTTAGSWAVLIVADIVSVFAVLQFIGLRRLNRDKK
ncbi:MAG: hypothetical protein K8I82_07075 [Anaerolineae bacterium]|nr:hypothetical protein [Anaerolineae bacterium]